MFYVAGKPTKQFLNLNEVKTKYPQLMEKVHFVPLDDAKILQEYTVSELGPRDYDWPETTVLTIAVKAALITYDFSAKDTAYYKMRCSQLFKVAQAIRENIDSLRANGHPKWKEVNLDEQVGLWEWDACSRSGGKAENPGNVEKSGGLADDLENTIKQGW